MMYEIGKRNAFPYELFNDFFATASGRAYPMKTDVRLEGDNYVMEVELPGVKKENIDISYKEEYLTISVKTDSVKTEKAEKRDFLLNERHYEASYRSYYVGEIDQTKIEAKLENGVLEVKFPKEAKKDTPYQISIN